MVYITKYEPNVNEKYIRDVESYFNLHLNLKSFDDTDKYIMETIDSAYIVDVNTNCIKTKFGITSLENLSTSCKAVLVYNYLRKNNISATLNITECGYNALDCLFSIVSDNKNNIFVLRHCDDIWLCKNRDFCVDGIKGDNLWNLMV